MIRVVHVVDDTIVVDSLRALMNNTLLFIRRRQLIQVITLLLHEVLGVHIKQLMVLAYVH